ncbi:MAG: two-component system response regulator [Desulfuromonadaceae bacterium GWB2_53_15]|nr:MAG: two-component system response regulator [Desulfuromonadaceae bacterium GWB2_53_15]
MKHLGDILVEAELISRKTLERALERQKGEKKRLGMVLEEMGVITEEELAEALAKQFNFKTIKNFISHSFSQELLDLLPSDFAMKKLVFPLKQKDNMLAVAITDPFDVETMEMLSRITGFQIIPVISTRKEILDAISKNYLKSNIGVSECDSILVVEDSTTVATVIQVALAKEGFNVLVAHDGLEGLKLAISERPRIIITDSVMPRMDGYGLLRAIKANPMTADIPVIMLTSKASTEDEQKALEFGFIDFIPKPVQPMRIVSRVKRVMELTQKYRR